MNTGPDIANVISAEFKLYLLDSLLERVGSIAPVAKIPKDSLKRRGGPFTILHSLINGRPDTSGEYLGQYLSLMKIQKNEVWNGPHAEIALETFLPS